MERAHVLIRLRGDSDASSDPTAPQLSAPAMRKLDGVTRTSATTVRLEHSDMSPGVASITFEQVYDEQHSSAHIFAQSLAPAVARCVDGENATVVVAGASQSGKTFMCHGDVQQHTPGVAPLALQHVFYELAQLRTLEPALVSHVRLACVYSRQDATTIDACIDLLQSLPSTNSTADASTFEQLLQHYAVTVTSAAAAVDLYTQARQRATTIEANGAFVLVLDIETQRRDESNKRCGRFTCIDSDSSAIVDAAASGSAPQSTAMQFMMHPAAATALFVIVTIHKHAQVQQQAIQSLLFACKAKDWATHRTTGTRQQQQQQQQQQQDASNSNSRLQTRKSFRSHYDRSPPISPASATTSSDATSDDCSAAAAAAVVSPPRSLPTRHSPSSQLAKHALVAQRLRLAYDAIKTTTSTPSNATAATAAAGVRPTNRHLTDRFDAVTTNDWQSLHAQADATLVLSRSLSSSTNTNDSLDAQSLLHKLLRIHNYAEETTNALAHVTNVNRKCVERIATLSQSLRFQQTEHETQIQTLQLTLQTKEQQFDAVSADVTQLQAVVAALKAPAPSTAEAAHRELLVQFATRLETATMEAKAVVEFKDQQIDALKQQLTAASAAATALAIKTRTQQQRDEEGAFAVALGATKSALQQAQTNADCIDALLSTRTRAWIAASAANAANKRHIELLQRRIADVVRIAERSSRKTNKQIKRLQRDCKRIESERNEAEDCRNDAQDDRKQLELVVTQLTANDSVRQKEILEWTQANAALAQRVATLEQQLEAARAETVALTCERDAAAAAVEQERAARDATLATRLVEQAAQLTATHEEALRNIEERHAAELRHACADAAAASHLPLSSLAAASTTTTSSSRQSHQQSIDDLDAVIDAKQKQLAPRNVSPVTVSSRSSRSSRRKQGPITAISPDGGVKRKLEELTRAVAVANEQETRAKAQMQQLADAQYATTKDRERLLTEMNRLKHENWSLSLALQVTERRSTAGCSSTATSAASATAA